MRPRAELGPRSGSPIRVHLAAEGNEGGKEERDDTNARPRALGVTAARGRARPGRAVPRHLRSPPRLSPHGSAPRTGSAVTLCSFYLPFSPRSTRYRSPSQHHRSGSHPARSGSSGSVSRPTRRSDRERARNSVSSRRAARSRSRAARGARPQPRSAR